MTNKNMSRQSSRVFLKLQEVLERYYNGISMSCLSLLERGYQDKFNKSLDYKSLGVSDIKELVDKMGNKGMVFFKVRESKGSYVMSVRIIETRRQVLLKNRVKKILDRCSGEIAFDSFEVLYKDQFTWKFNYDFFALTDLDHLCQVLNDILVVEVNPSGEKVIKAAVKIYNLRKRKK